MGSARDDRRAFGVYVHWPFCLSKCPYCDFNSHVRHAAVDEDRFARAFAREIETTAARVPGWKEAFGEEAGGLYFVIFDQPDNAIQKPFALPAGRKVRCPSVDRVADVLSR